MIRLSAALVFVMACVSQAKSVVAPEPPDGSGTLSCREIVEQCDSACSDPFCIQRCTGQGNVDGAAQHGALVDCGQRNSCTDQDCMQANCPGEIQTCMGEPAAPQPGDGTAPDGTHPAGGPPGETPSSGSSVPQPGA